MKTYSPQKTADKARELVSVMSPIERSRLESYAREYLSKSKLMRQALDKQDYETAAKWRDYLRKI